jgi:hypothetical protein
MATRVEATKRAMVRAATEMATAMKRVMARAARAMATALKRALTAAARAMTTAPKRVRARAARAKAMATWVSGKGKQRQQRGQWQQGQVWWVTKQALATKM